MVDKAKEIDLCGKSYRERTSKVLGFRDLVFVMLDIMLSSRVDEENFLTQFFVLLRKWRDASYSSGEPVYKTKVFSKSERARCESARKLICDYENRMKFIRRNYPRMVERSFSKEGYEKFKQRMAELEAEPVEYRDIAPYETNEQ